MNKLTDEQRTEFEALLNDANIALDELSTWVKALDNDTKIAMAHEYVKQINQTSTRLSHTIKAFRAAIKKSKENDNGNQEVLA